MEQTNETHSLSKKDIKELQEVLVQACIDFINDRHIDDLDEIRFSMDMIQESARFGKWQPCTDSSIVGFKMTTDIHGLPHRELLQEYT